MTQPRRSEIQLLLQCASPPGDVARSERIYMLSGEPLDWEYLQATALGHKVMPLVYWELNACRPDVIPAALSTEYHNNVCSNLLRVADLNAVLELLRCEGIGAMPFKGPALAMQAYGNLALRQFVDLDIMVRPEDALRARALLLKNGFMTNLNLSTRREQSYLRVYDEFVLTGPGGGPMVEVHWAVAPHYFSTPVDVGPFWDRGMQTRLGNREVKTLGLEDLMFLLCLHGTKHCWSQLSMVTDIARLMTYQKILWVDVLDRAREAGILRIVLLGVELVRRLFGVSGIPEEAGLVEREVGLLADRVEQQLFDPAPRGIVRSGRFHMEAREHRADRIRYFCRLAMTSGIEDWQLINLPAALESLYLFFRIPRLARKYWMKVP